MPPTHTRETPPAACPARPPLTALITSYNEEHNIADCLHSVLWCDEILVVDSFSTDATVAIARSFPKVRILQRSYFGGAAQKNWAMGRARHDWLLIVDSDERVSPQLRTEIESTLRGSPAPAAYSIPRRTIFLGHPLRFSGWQNDRVTRLVHRSVARYPNRRVHADMTTRQPAMRLSATMDHHMVQDFHEYAQRVNRYALWGAAQLWRDGRRAGLYQVVVRPSWRFLRTYFLQRGVLEGLPGLTMCLLQAWGTYLKWSTLWAWRHGAARGKEPLLPPFDDDEATWAWPSSPGAEIQNHRVRAGRGGALRAADQT